MVLVFGYLALKKFWNSCGNFLKEFVSTLVRIIALFVRLSFPLLLFVALFLFDLVCDQVRH